MMSEEPDTVQAPVAIHRWFADGEGWARHPFLKNQFSEIVSVAKTHLLRRNEIAEDDDRRFEQAIPGGYVLGSQVTDPDCLDAKAHGRYPTILRLVVLLGEPASSDKKAVWRDLATTGAERSGEDAALTITIPAGCHEPGSSTSETTGGTKTPVVVPPEKKMWRRLVLLAGIVLVVVAGLCAFVFLQPTEAQAEDTLEVSEEMWKLLKNWGDKGTEDLDPPQGSSIKGNTQSKVINRFFAFLSQGELSAKISSNHPDARFLQRLPQKGSIQTDVWNQEEIRMALREWIDRVAGQPAKPARGKEYTSLQLLQQVELKMNYQAWLLEGSYRLTKRQERNRDSDRDFPWDSVVDPGVRTYVSHFLPPSEQTGDWEKEAAAKMVTMLNDWKVRGVVKYDAERRPWFVFHCFFQLLRKDGFLDPNPTSNPTDSPWNDQFVIRFPLNPVCVKTNFSNESEFVSKGLKPLASAFQLESSTLSATLFKRISNRLDFDTWKSEELEDLKKKMRPVPKTDDSEDPRVNKFAERFRTGDER